MATILKSWKEIAHHFKAGVRTVQRWERLRSLPVYRARGTRRSPVLAYSAELNTWLHSQHAPKDHARRANNTPQLLARHGVLLDELTQFMHAQGSMIAELSAMHHALSKFCPALAKGGSARQKCRLAGLGRRGAR
jgi:hypothetical protein